MVGLTWNVAEGIKKSLNFQFNIAVNLNKIGDTK